VVDIPKTKIVLFILGFLILVFLGNYLFAKKYLEPKMIDGVVKKIQEQIDENYSARMDNINSQLRNIDNKINVVEKKRQEIAKQVSDLRKQRAEYKPPANLDEAVKALKARGYEVTIKK
jgi:uncharacterized coiled-coil DUF342 family protein